MQQIYIDGVYVDATGQLAHEIINPATLMRLGSAAQCDAQDVDRAVAAARKALPDWRQLPAERKGALLAEVGAQIRMHSAEIGMLLTLETGKPLCESADCVTAVATMFGSAGARAARSAASSPATGVVALLSPYNFPLLFTAGAIVSALIAGNTVVCKPAAQNPLSSLRLGGAFGALPAGVVNIVTGDAETGRILLRHPDIAQVRFTGSAAAGREISAAFNGGQAVIEAGAVGALIVCADADLDMTVPAVAWTRLFNGGQACTSGKHIYVEHSIAADFAERMHQCIGFLDVDDPTRGATDLGPVISAQAANRVEDQVGRALRQGAKLILGGRRFRPSGLPGHFFQPTILTSVPADGVPTCEEILGPVVTITPVKDVLGVIRSSGAARLASIYTRDAKRVLQHLQDAEPGLIRVNDPAIDGAGPFGALKHGVLRLLRRSDAPDYVAADVQRKSWWFPYASRGRAVTDWS